ncbi:cytidylate kinase [Mycoplasmopsis canis UFG4]|uniref:Cytidylate kinase n=2 Tax=Mycoplasmopsis canis TaxID=29555 RepID=I1A4F5_9BACT|nr:(d)CMP kinase [Mycoplasmopsis canis]AKF41426.1 cytidylate kinase [Mycoplasmopsis canis]AMD81547.1 cytidylate kinase [Mycoplasmopsis canis PG 14]EIE39283.1 cytidylate kinase [Mycoplasmopsis canis UF33]EIE39435.1 cytidylate kinase [Mycoplasmopsis canis PG 14]EIE39588.1 cytidylate kinase [Mycoplasmopsis canis UF31]
MKVNIAIDGPSGVGKSTVSKEIAKRLGYTFINSGSVYRAIAKNAVDKGVDTRDVENVIKTLEVGMIKLLADDKIELRGVDISHQIRADYISQVTPNIAKIPEVREFVVDHIQYMTKKGKGYIIDGRDTTFKIMPHAEVKIFLWAEAEERARRRMIQNQELGYNTGFNEVLYDVKKRDEQDMNREVDPLHKTEDSVFIDCTELTIEEVIAKIISLVNEKIGK